MKIALGCDHAGIAVKDLVIKYLTDNGYEYKDFGTYTKDSCDYPEFALATAEAVASGEFERGILICSTGIGISIAANKVKGIRCAHCSDSYSARYTRFHNDANMLAFGANVVGPSIIIDIIEAFLTSEFEGGRHQRRVDKITAIENKYFK